MPRIGPSGVSGRARSTGPNEPGLAQPVVWGDKKEVITNGPIRIRVDFTGVRPEDLRLYAIYVQPELSALSGSN